MATSDAASSSGSGSPSSLAAPDGQVIPLASGSTGTLAAVLRGRRSTKSTPGGSLASGALADLLVQTVGERPDGTRPYGSAHARYAVRVTVFAAEVDGVPAGVYGYDPTGTALHLRERGDHRSSLAAATIDGAWIDACPLILMLSADLGAAREAFAAQSPDRGEQFCWLEAGLLTQNIHLWASDRDLGTVFIGGLRSHEVQNLSRTWTPDGHTVLGLLPVCHPISVPMISTSP